MAHKQPRTVMVWLASAAVATLLLPTGCTSERTISPPLAKSNLVMLGWDVSPSRTWIAVLDTEADTIIGEIPDVGSSRAIEIETSEDERLTATMAIGEGVRLFDLKTLSLIGQVPHQGLSSLEMVFDPPRLFAMTDRTPSIVYDLPSLEVDTVLSEIYRLCLASPKPGEVVVITRSDGGVLDPTWDGAARLSTDDWGIIDSFVFVSPETNGLVRTVDAVLSPDAETIFLIATDVAGDALLAFDLNHHSCLFRTDILTRWYSSISISPDAREVWITQGYPNDGTPVPSTLGLVLIIDAQSGRVLDTISTIGLRVDRPGEPFPLGPLTFHPTEPKAYLCSGNPNQSLLVVNTKSRAVESVLEMGPLYDIAIVPR